jgi:uncharacterized membrane protein
VSTEPRPDIPARTFSVADRARLIKTLCSRLVHFPRRDEVLATLVRRWPSLFDARESPAVADQPDESAEATSAVPLQGDPSAHSLQQEIVQLRQALESNRDIGAATGIIMSRFRLTRDQAFDALRMVSQRQHRKLREVADDVLTTGTLDTAALQDRARSRPPDQG